MVSHWSSQARLEVKWEVIVLHRDMIMISVSVLISMVCAAFSTTVVSLTGVNSSYSAFYYYQGNQHKVAEIHIHTSYSWNINDVYDQVSWKQSNNATVSINAIGDINKYKTTLASRLLSRLSAKMKVLFFFKHFIHLLYKFSFIKGCWHLTYKVKSFSKINLVQMLVMSQPDKCSSLSLTTFN